MAPRRKKIRDMTAEEAAALSGAEVMESIFGKRAARKLKEIAHEGDDEPKPEKSPAPPEKTW